MPRVHTYQMVGWGTPIPVAIPRPYQILTRPGMAAASVLFAAKQFQPFVCQTVSTAPDRLGARRLADRYERLRRQRVAIDDGVTLAPGTVVLDVASVLTDAGLCIGGNAPGDRWEVVTTWSFLIDADLDRG